MTTLTAQQIACVYAWLAQLFSVSWTMNSGANRQCADG